MTTPSIGEKFALNRAILSVMLGFYVCASFAQDTRPPPSGLEGFRIDPSWPDRLSTIEWGGIPGVAVDAKDNVWVYSRRAPHLLIYSPKGDLLKTWPGEVEHKAPHQLRFDSAGNVWMADTDLHTVRKFSPNGKLLLTLGRPGIAGADETHLNKPTDMAIAPAGDVFVADGYGNNRIVHFDRYGKFVKAWGKFGAASGEFNLPHAICLDSKGRIYVADRSNARIQVFDQSGAFLDEWRNLLVPWGLWVTPNDELWVCGSSPTLEYNGVNMMTGIPPHDQVLMRFSTSGKLLELWSPKLGVEGQEKPGETVWVHGIAMDSKGNLYVGDVKGRRVQKFTRIR